MKLKIVSDGTGRNTKVMDVETGEMLEYVTKVVWTADNSGPTQALITVIDIPVEVVSEAEIEKLPLHDGEKA